MKIAFILILLDPRWRNSSTSSIIAPWIVTVLTYYLGLRFWLNVHTSSWRYRPDYGDCIFSICHDLRRLICYSIHFSAKLKRSVASPWPCFSPRLVTVGTLSFTSFWSLVWIQVSVMGEFINFTSLIIIPNVNKADSNISPSMQSYAYLKSADIVY